MFTGKQKKDLSIYIIIKNKFEKYYKVAFAYRK